jgi:hypothetical protein
MEHLSVVAAPLGPAPLEPAAAVAAPLAPLAPAEASRTAGRATSKTVLAE